MLAPCILSPSMTSRGLFSFTTTSASALIGESLSSLIRARATAVLQALTDLCEVNDLHLIEKDCQFKHVQLVLRLRPTQVIADELKKLKGRSSAAMVKELGIDLPIWARGYLARSRGRVRVQAVTRYLDTQAEHHGYTKRERVPVFRFKATEPKALATANASFELMHHVVLATRYRRSVFVRIQARLSSTTGYASRPSMTLQLIRLLSFPITFIFLFESSCVA